MNYIDFIIIFFLFIGFSLGFRDGLIRKVIGLVGLALGIILALEFYQGVALKIAPFINDEIYLAEIVSWLVIFIGTMFLASILKRIIHPLDKVNRFTNQLLGGISGTLQILFFVSGFLLFLDVFNVPNKDTRNTSLLYHKSYQVIPVTIDLVVGKDSEAKDLINSFIEQSSDIEVESDTSKIDTSKVVEENINIEAKEDEEK